MTGSDTVVDQCDECGADLCYYGNKFGSDRLCDPCYDRISVMRR